jgi:hypothetical protein
MLSVYFLYHIPFSSVRGFSYLKTILLEFVREKLLCFWSWEFRLTQWTIKYRRVYFTGHGSQVTGHGSRVTGHGSRVTGHESQVTGHGSQVTGHRFMSTSTPVMWSLSLQQGIFRVYLVLERRLCRHVAIVGARSRVRVASKLLVFWGEINTNGHTVMCLAWLTLNILF